MCVLTHKLARPAHSGLTSPLRLATLPPPDHHYHHHFHYNHASASESFSVSQLQTWALFSRTLATRYRCQEQLPSRHSARRRFKVGALRTSTLHTRGMSALPPCHLKYCMHHVTCRFILCELISRCRFATQCPYTCVHHLDGIKPI
jgi:hypothetical protein